MNNSLRSTAITLALTLAVFPAGLHAQNPQDVERIHVTSDTTQKGIGTLINIDADDAFLPKVLSILADISGYNIVSGPEVDKKQKISIHLKNTPVEEAMNLVVRAAGLSYEIVGNSFLVTDHANLKKEVGINSYFVELQYAKAEEVKDLLKGLAENVQVAPGLNALVIATSPKVIAEVREIIKRVDVPSKQIMLETRMVEVSIDKLRELGIDWEKISKLTTIIAEDPADPALGGRAPTKAELGTFELGKLPSEHIYQKIDGFKDVGYFSRQLTAFDITIDWLLKTNQGKLLTNSKLTTMNNRKATILIGEVIPFLVQSQQTAQVEREEIGIKMELTPQINSEGYITLNVKPEVSTIVELIDGRIPRKKIRTAETTVLVRNRQKIVIAGLISDNAQELVHKIPLFGDLPFFGRFFQHLEQSHLKTDLIIEITPYILTKMEDVAGIISDSLTDLRDSLSRAREEYKRDPEIFEPTHLGLLPSARVLKPYQFSVGVHEVSAGLYPPMQLIITPPFQNYGRLFVGIKHQIANSLAFGLGYADDLEEQYADAWLGPRAKLFVANNLLATRYFDWVGLINGEFGTYQSGGAGTAVVLKPFPFFSVIYEMSFLYTHNPPLGKSNMDSEDAALVRLKWPKHFSFDVGARRLVPKIVETPEYDLHFDFAYTSVF